MALAIRGNVLSSPTSGTPLALATVKVALGMESEPEWTVQTDGAGQFKIPLTETEADELLGGRRHRELVFKIYSTTVITIGTTSQVILVFIGCQTVFVSRATLRGTYAVNLHANPTFTLMTGVPNFAVAGYLVDPDGTPRDAVTVGVFRKDLRTETPLGTATTDSEGRFLIRYAGTAGGHDDTADFTIRIEADDATISRCNPPSDLAVRLVSENATYRGQSDYELDYQSFFPLLDTATFAELTVEDVEFFMCRTEVDSAGVARLARAHSLGDVTGISAAALYAFAYAGLPLTRNLLYGLGEDDVTSALERAVADNAVPASVLSDAATIAATLAAARVDWMVPAADPGSTTLGSVLVAATLGAGKPREFAVAYAAHPGPAEQFWIDLRADTINFPGTLVDRIQFTLQVGALTASHPPLVKLLHAKRDNTDFVYAAELAKYTVAEWIGFLGEIVDGSPVHTPLGVVGDDSTAQRANYAQAVARMIEDLFPSAHLAYRLPNGSVIGGFAVFIAKNPGFSFLRTRISDFLPGAVGLPTDPEDLATLEHDLLKIQRVAALGPRFARTSTALTLLDKGIHSAQQIQRMGHAAFMARMAATPVSGIATTVYDRADQIASVALHAFLHSRPEMHFPQTLGIPTPGCGDVDLEEIFGSLDYCACKHCESVLGPAAYFADIMMFLQDRELGEGTYLDVLLERRPELDDIKLNCANSDTPLPTIDLVNEILEYKLRGLLEAEEYEIEADVTPNTWQTTWSAEDLVAHPEHVDEPVYDALADEANTFFPLTLPFDLSLAEVRGYLGLLGLSLTRMQDALEWWDGLGEDEEFRVNERLGLSEGHGNLIRLEEPGPPTLAELWNSSGVDWVEQINVVDNFLGRAGLSFPELQALLRTRFLQDVRLQYDEPCTLVDAKLVNVINPTLPGLNTSRLRSMHRFLRVLRALGWSFQELDATLYAFDAWFADNPSVNLAKVARFVRMRQRFPRLPIGEVLSWWAPLDQHVYVDGDPSYYDVVVRPRTRELAFVELAGDVPFSAVRGSILGITQLDESGLNAGYEATGLDGDSFLTLINLSKLYRVSSIARAAGLPVSELVILTHYTAALHEGDGPFIGTPAAPVRELLDIADAVTHSGFSVSALDWVVRDQQPEKFGASDLEVMRTLISLITSLQQAAEDHAQSLPPPELTALERVEKLLTGPMGDRLADAMKFVRKELAGDPEELREALFPFLAIGGDAYDAFGAAYGAPESLTSEERAELLEAELGPWLRQQRLERTVVQLLAPVLRLEPADVANLLSAYENVDGKAITLLTADAFFAKTSFDSEADAPKVKDETFPAQFIERTDVTPRAGLLRGLLKVALVSSTFRFSSGLLRWLLANASDVSVSILDLAHLPTGSPTDEQVYEAYAGWDWLRRAVRVRDKILSEPTTLTTLLDLFFASPFDKTDALEALAGAAGWDLAALLAFEAANPVPLTQADFKSLEAVEALAALFDLGATLGAQPATVHAWAKTEAFDNEDADAIKGAVQGRFSAPAWLVAAQPVRDRLRERQRDALADLLVHKMPGVETREDLFGELLMDVDISCCGRTTRILFATAAVQLFIQRAFMSLESVELTDHDAERWSWMRRYRVWEANRKIFLYPENWVSPELRDDKTPLFKRLEEEIAQSEADETSVEKAYIHYLEGLHEIARLNICGMHHEIEREDSEPYTVLRDQLHVFGRTQGDPSKVYYRRHVQGAYWTPWVELPFLVEHTDVLPIVANRRLMLFWPKIEVRGGDHDSSPTTDSSGVKPGVNTPVRKHRQIRLMWAEYRDGEWSSVQTSEGSLRIDPADHAEARDEGRHRNRDISMTVALENGIVKVYITKNRLTYKQKSVDSVFFLQFGSFTFNPCTGQFDAAPLLLPILGSGWADTLHSFQPSPLCTVSWHQGYRLPDGMAPGTWVALPVHNKIGEPFSWSKKLIKPKQGFELMVPRQDPAIDAHRPFVYSDQKAILFFQHRSTWDLVDADANKTSTAAYSQVDIMPYMGFADDKIEFTESSMDYNTTLGLGGGESVATTKEWEPSFDLAIPPEYRASNLYHPYVCEFLEQIRLFGVPGLLDPEVAEGATGSALVYQAKHSIPDSFGHFDGVKAVEQPYPNQNIDFLYGGSYSAYNWELFYHIPMYIADRLMSERRFAEAQEWLGYIFNPLRAATTIEDSDCKYYWRIKPFREASAKLSIDDLFELLHYDGKDTTVLDAKDDVVQQIEAWRYNPFKPHLVARTRPTAYMRAVVMKYLDNLIAWGDDLFRQDTRESTQEATQLYVLALQILGPRPREVDGHAHDDKSFDEAVELDSFANFLVELENEIFGVKPPGLQGPSDKIKQAHHQLQHPENFQIGHIVPQDSGPPLADKPKAPPPHPKPPFNPFPLGGNVQPMEMELYFCIPPNDKLLGYWDLVADRLFKLRHCLNIEGIRRDLALFDPPIDPGLLAKAAAQGVDISTAIGNLHAPLPHYRFLVHLGIAKEFAAQVSNLGSSLLQALEKRDAEALAILRAGHELSLLGSITKLKETAIKEAEVNVEALELGRAVAEKRQQFYSSRERMNPLEKAELGLMVISTILDIVGGALTMAGSATAVIPNATVGISGISGTPVTTVTVGGTQATSGLGLAGQAVGQIAGVTRTVANILATQASYTRRKEDWDFQAQLAEREITQIDRQITAGQIRTRMSALELDNHKKQIEQSTEALEIMQSKFTNQELYNWMSGEVSKLYHQAYQLAIDLARRTERCYRYELATDSEFIQFGHWDNRRQGLLAGERLGHELRRMEAAYYENNRREYELTKRVSLASLDPVALISLRKTGACHFELPSLIFNLDHPSHFLRRIKSVGVTMPAVTGPYTNVGISLTYESGSLRSAPAADVLPDTNSPVQSVAISVGQEDTGMFEPNLRDERYLPFEGKALEASKWRIELPVKIRQFDYETISDVIITVRYTAREGGSTTSGIVNATLGTDLNEFQRADGAAHGVGQLRIFSARAEFPEAWRSFLAAGGESGGATLDMDLSEERFPHPQVPPGSRTINFVALFARWPANDDAPGSGVFTGAELTPEGETDVGLTLFTKYKDDMSGEPKYNYVFTAATGTTLGKQPKTWSLFVPEAGWPDAPDPEDIVVVVQYALS